jgi:hypothetical protein
MCGAFANGKRIPLQIDAAIAAGDAVEDEAEHQGLIDKHPGEESPR